MWRVGSRSIRSGGHCLEIHAGFCGVDRRILASEKGNSMTPILVFLGGRIGRWLGFWVNWVENIFIWFNAEHFCS